VFTREEIAKKGDNLDIGLIADESLSIYENLPDPIDSAEEAVEKLELAISLLNEVIAELKAVEQPNTYQTTSKEMKVAETSEVLKK
jgi:type I restriction enzyme M protein